MPTPRRLLILLGALVLVVGCSPAETGSSTTEPAEPTSTSSTIVEATTSSVVQSTTSTVENTTTSSAVPDTTTTPGSNFTVEEIMAAVQADLDDEFAESEPPEGVVGPDQMHCVDSGAISVGGVLACEAIPQTAPDFELDTAGILVYVIDDAPTVAYLIGTDVPRDAAQLKAVYDASPKGLYCRDLLDENVVTWFSGVGTRPDTGYFLSLVYWSLEGRPDRMDADHDGIPCETVYDAGVIADVLAGGRVY
ncbi:MAG: hypothetical protein WCE80_05330 [Acidimicrobiia bacterium]